MPPGLRWTTASLEELEQLRPQDGDVKASDDEQESSTSESKQTQAIENQSESKQIDANRSKSKRIKTNRSKSKRIKANRSKLSKSKQISGNESRSKRFKVNIEANIHANRTSCSKSMQIEMNQIKLLYALQFTFITPLVITARRLFCNYLGCSGNQIPATPLPIRRGTIF